MFRQTFLVLLAYTVAVSNAQTQPTVTACISSQPAFDCTNSISDFCSALSSFVFNVGDSGARCYNTGTVINGQPVACMFNGFSEFGGDGSISTAANCGAALQLVSEECPGSAGIGYHGGDFTWTMASRFGTCGNMDGISAL
ncbi:hypothetical protein C8R45DRAFT_1111835 [Mycena sanguinolenta]|nr:hypothetical protein C8R45DRAFT_1111835 [Mycena sanguinolenta]